MCVPKHPVSSKAVRTELVQWGHTLLSYLSVDFSYNDSTLMYCFRDKILWLANWGRPHLTWGPRLFSDFLYARPHYNALDTLYKRNVTCIQ